MAPPQVDSMGSICHTIITPPAVPVAWVWNIRVYRISNLATDGYIRCGMIKASELARGKVVVYEGKMYTVKDLTHVSKGNWRSYMQVKLKDFKTGQIIDQRFNMDDRIETAFVQTKEYEYLYRDGAEFVLADTETYDQIPVDEEMFGDSFKFLKENMRVTCAIVDGKIVSLELPNTVELKVIDTPPVVKGATATNQPKDAELEGGARVRVPAFIQVGEVVRVDTRTGEYIERAK